MATYILPASDHYREYCVWAVIWLIEMSSSNTYLVNHVRILLARIWHLSTRENLPHQHTYSSQTSAWERQWAAPPLL